MAKASGSIDLKSLKVAGEGASKYITSIDSNTGIQIQAENNTRNICINSQSVDIRQGTDILATFGSPTRIGQDGAENVTITSNGVSINTPILSTAVNMTAEVVDEETRGIITFGDVYDESDQDAPMISGYCDQEVASLRIQGKSLDGHGEGGVFIQGTGPDIGDGETYSLVHASGLGDVVIQASNRDYNTSFQVSTGSIYIDGLDSVYINSGEHEAAWVSRSEVGNTENSWNYRKYSDGTFDAWGTFTVTPTSSTASGNIYYSNSITVALPFTAKSGTGIATGSVGAQFAWLVNTSVATANVSFRIARGTAISTSTALSVRLHIFGEY